MDIEEHESASWLLTYADLMTLLLVFFVLMFSLSTIQEDRFLSISDNIKSALKRYDTSIIELPESPSIQPLPVETEFPLDIIEKDHELEPLAYALVSSFQTNNVMHKVNVSEPKNGKIYIRVNGAVLFDSGDASFKPEIQPILDGIIENLNKFPAYRLDIMGHTDNQPIATARFPSNWELSAIRATTVLRYFIENDIKPTRLTATGFGDAVSLEENDSEAHRAINRRIEFVLTKQAE